MREVGPKQKPVASKRQSWVEYLSFQFYNFLLIFYGIFVKEKSKTNCMECFIIKKKKMREPEVSRRQSWVDVGGHQAGNSQPCKGRPEHFISSDRSSYTEA